MRDCLSHCLNALWFLESVPFVYKSSTACTPPSVSSHPICSMMELFRMELLLVSVSNISQYFLYMYIYMSTLRDTQNVFVLMLTSIRWAWAVMMPSRIVVVKIGWIFFFDINKYHLTFLGFLISFSWASAVRNWLSMACTWQADVLLCHHGPRGNCLLWNILPQQVNILIVIKLFVCLFFVDPETQIQFNFTNIDS